MIKIKWRLCVRKIEQSQSIITPSLKVDKLFPLKRANIHHLNNVSADHSVRTETKRVFHISLRKFQVDCRQNNSTEFLIQMTNMHSAFECADCEIENDSNHY